ncbi:phosphoglucosamine mutase [Candidatus Halobonum tyrrellensis G22]|uniref:Phosphoglucosamine mutase n=1 Tax=Candidatus Halobonum tyrrellensis G22 TaxID=1324957 RepID=V4IUR5_9EURY|nr:phosphoglucosamine mutase [Candidatus Halobonum tyrrellensis G22]
MGTDVTADLAVSVGRAVAAEGADRVVLGRDARVHGDVLADALAAGLRESGAEVLRLGVAATPTVARSVDWYDADAGVVVTASHNPPSDNGIKLWTPSGRAFPAERREAVADLIAADDAPRAAWDAFGDQRRVEDAAERHVETLVAGAELSDPPSVVVDVGNGTGGVTVEALLRLGCDVETLNATPDGRFPARPSEPTAENCGTLARTVAATDADFGVAHDGDADRMMAVTGDGEFVGGDELLAVFGLAAVDDDDRDRVAAPVNTSSAVDDALAARDAGVERTAVGDGFVADATLGDRVVFGGEPSGAWIWPDRALCPDGPLAAVTLAELVAERGSLAVLLDDVPDYPIRRDAVETDAGEAVMERVEGRLAERFPQVTAIDGVRGDTDEGWVLVRPSGTQPLVRVTAEARDAETAGDLLAEARALVEAAVEETGTDAE